MRAPFLIEVPLWLSRAGGYGSWGILATRTWRASASGCSSVSTTAPAQSMSLKYEPASEPLQVGTADGGSSQHAPGADPRVAAASRQQPHARAPRRPVAGIFFFTLITGPRRSLSLKLSDTRVYEPQRLLLRVNNRSRAPPADPWQVHCNARLEGPLTRGTSLGGVPREQKMLKGHLPESYITRYTSKRR